MSSSLEQTLSQKLSIGDKESSSASSVDGHLSPNPGGLSPVPTSPSGDDSSSTKEKRISFGKVTENMISRDDQPSPPSGPINLSSNSSSTATNHKGSSLPLTPTSPSKSRHPSSSSQGSDKEKSVRVTRKVFNTWRSVCGKKTKDLFKRWKTLPESQGEGDNHTSRSGGSGVGGSTATPPNTPGVGGGESFSSTGGGGINKIKMLVKKHSEVEMPSSSSVHDDTHMKSSTGWSVHVWATYVQRGSEEESDPVEAQPGRDFLSDFQKVKLTHFFRHVLDMNHDDVISAADFVALNQRIRHYIEWSSECIEFHILKEVHSGFLECFLNQPLDDCSVMYYCNSERETKEHVNLDEWLDTWGDLLKSVRVLEALPLWLQYFPKILFQVINKSGSGIISKEQLRAFYTMFLGIDFRVVNDTLDSIYCAMTDKGKHKVTYDLYKLCFANFLFGKYPHGPGQYLFGICSPDSLDCAFPIDYSALNTPKDDLEPYNPEHDKDHSNRRSVIV